VTDEVTLLFGGYRFVGVVALARLGQGVICGIGRSLLPLLGPQTVDRTRTSLIHDPANNRAARRAVLDIGLPDMDGYEVARRLRDDIGLRDVRLVALSGHGGEEDRRRSGAAGIDAHVVKPIVPDLLAKLLAELAPNRPS
jgi:CheY-like chemotaxis protein